MIVSRTKIAAIAGALLLVAIAGPAGEGVAPVVKVPAVAPKAGGQAGDAGEFVRGLYKTLESRRPDLERLAAAVDPELLLGRAMTGLSSRPPEVWTLAARVRLAKETHRLVGKIFPRGVIVVAPTVVSARAQEGSGLTVVTVRFYRIDMNRSSQRPVWHQVHIARKSAGWRVADIDQMDSGNMLSYLAISRLTDLEQEKLPREGGAPVVALFAKTLLAGLLAALLLGLVIYFALVRSAGDEPRRRPRVLIMWVAILGSIIVGAVLFLSGLMEHMDRDAAIDEFQQRSQSLMFTADAEKMIIEARSQNNQQLAEQFLGQALRRLERALTSQQWANRQAQMTKVRVLALGGDKGAAESQLKVLASEAMDPPMPAAHLELAQLQQRSKKWAEAGQSLMGFVKAVGPDAHVYCQAAQCFALARQVKNAEQMLKLARETQEFDNPNKQGAYDGTLILGRAAVRASQKRVDDVIADFNLFLAPYEGGRTDPRIWVQKCMEIAGNLRSGQFDAVTRDPKFVAYMKTLQARMNAIMKKYQPPRGGPR